MKVSSDLSFFRTLLSREANELASVLHTPTLFDFSSSDRAPFFLSILLHGNETSGWDALRALVQEDYQDKSLPSCLILIGNVQAAQHGKRMLDGQPDFNRIWEGGSSPYSKWADDVISFLESKKPWFALDVHNNTGPNPHHSIVTSIDSTTMSAARLFSPTAIFAQQPPGVLTRRTSAFCTSITIEAGLPEDPASAARARKYISSLWNAGCVPETDTSDQELFQNNVRVLVENADTITDDQVPKFAPKLYRYNFKIIPEGTELARLVVDHARLMAVDEDQRDQTRTFLTYKGKNVSLKRDTILSMYTEDPRIARQDCVCYFLEPLQV